MMKGKLKGARLFFINLNISYYLTWYLHITAPPTAQNLSYRSYVVIEASKCSEANYSTDIATLMVTKWIMFAFSR